jgi:hypothetical protein
MRLISVLSCLMLISCHAPLPLAVSRSSFRPTQSSETIERYYPIAAGHRWTFALEQTRNDIPQPSKTMIMHTEPLGSEGEAQTAVLRRNYPASEVKPLPSLIKRFPDRVELSRYQGEILRESLNLPAEERGVNFVTALQMPFAAGNSWEGRIFQGGTETIRVVGTETVNTPAGRFDALKIEHHLRYHNGKEDFLRYWYAPHVGMVKLYEELTVYYGQWLKFKSTGTLTAFSTPAGQSDSSQPDPRL